MLYEIINMSDPYTIEAQSLDVAYVASMLLGRGQYALRPLAESGTELPLFLFGGIEEWCQSHLSASCESAVDKVMTDPAKRAELIACLESCLIGKPADRSTYFAGLDLIDDPAKREQWHSRWHNDRRSSMNDIGGRAYAIAAKLRTNTPGAAVPAPQQVFSGR